eukprot:gene11189-13224_t
MEWARRLPVYGRRSALIVAGDVATSIPTITETLQIFKQKFQEVFYIPGNHDLWCAGRMDDQWLAGSPGGCNSVTKMIHLMDTSVVRKLATIKPRGGGEFPYHRPGSKTGFEIEAQVGAQVESQVWGGGLAGLKGGLGGAAGSYVDYPDAEVEILPMYSWYKSTFFGEEHSQLSTMEQSFDAACLWPAGVGDEDAPRFSLSHRIADFMLELNLPFIRHRQNERQDSIPGISFSHFIPKPTLYWGYSNLRKVMGCQELGEQVFGHSHLPVDKEIDGCRYLQDALGYPNDRYGRDPLPMRVWPIAAK